MPIQIKANIRQSTVKLIGKIIFPLVDTGIVTLAEYNEIMSNLRYLSKKGTLIPDVLPKLIKTKDVADIFWGSPPRNFVNWKARISFRFEDATLVKVSGFVT